MTAEESTLLHEMNAKMVSIHTVLVGMDGSGGLVRKFDILEKSHNERGLREKDCSLAAKIIALELTGHDKKTYRLWFIGIAVVAIASIASQWIMRLVK